MCKDGACGQVTNDKAEDLKDAAPAAAVLEYIDAHSEAIDKQFEEIFARHPAVRQSDAKDEATKHKLKKVLHKIARDFYMLGTANTLRYTDWDDFKVLEAKHAAEVPEDVGEAISGLLRLFAAEVMKAEQGAKVTAQSFNPEDVGTLKVDTAEDAMILDTRTGKAHRIETAGKTEDEIRQAIAAMVASWGA